VIVNVIQRFTIIIIIIIIIEEAIIDIE